ATQELFLIETPEAASIEEIVYVVEGNNESAE
ncbi:30S ribosomal protein S2, partial [Enterococcus faecalis]